MNTLRDKGHGGGAQIADSHGGGNLLASHLAVALECVSKADFGCILFSGDFPGNSQVLTNSLVNVPCDIFAHDIRGVDVKSCLGVQPFALFTGGLSPEHSKIISVGASRIGIGGDVGCHMVFVGALPMCLGLAGFPKDW